MVAEIINLAEYREKKARESRTISVTLTYPVPCEESLMSEITDFIEQMESKKRAAFSAKTLKRCDPKAFEELPDDVKVWAENVIVEFYGDSPSENEF